MTTIHRRSFLKVAAVSAAGAALSSVAVRADDGKRRKFTIDLNPGAVGINADPRAVIDLAARHGFESVAPSPDFLAGLSDDENDALLADLRAKNLVWGAAGLPVDFRKDDDTFQGDLERLPRLASALQRAGCTRVGTWISPAHRSLSYMANFRQHAQRLREVATVLGDHGLRFGLEYVGPKTSWTAGRHPFIHTMAEMRELIAAIERDNVGLVLDSWHWYTAGDTREELLALKNSDVVACDLNDAPAGLAVDEQMDLRRELPTATGVIDLKTFLGCLVEIGYDGPVRAEPFNQALNALDNEAAAARTSEMMHKAMDLVGG